MLDMHLPQDASHLNLTGLLVFPRDRLKGYAHKGQELIGWHNVKQVINDLVFRPIGPVVPSERRHQCKMAKESEAGVLCADQSSVMLPVSRGNLDRDCVISHWSCNFPESNTCWSYIEQQRLLVEL